MRNILRALGVGIWSMIAVGLLAVFIAVGYREGMRFHVPNILGDSAAVKSPANVSGPAAGTHGNDPSVIARSPPSPPNTKIDAQRIYLQDAFNAHDYGKAIEYGTRLYVEGQAGSEDFDLLAQSSFALGDCQNTLMWANLATAGTKEGSAEVSTSRRLQDRCSSGHRGTPVIIADGDCARLSRQMDRFESKVPDRPSNGELLVLMGKRYFGSAEYERAVGAIQCGLLLGGVLHLDDAYVYLGRSYVALDDIEEARDAFAMLRQVPNISPRLVRLWELYADTLH